MTKSRTGIMETGYTKLTITVLIITVQLIINDIVSIDVKPTKHHTMTLPKINKIKHFPSVLPVHSLK